MTDWTKEAEAIRELVDPLLGAVYAQGKEGRSHDNEAGSAGGMREGGGSRSTRREDEGICFCHAPGDFTLEMAATIASAAHNHMPESNSND